MGRSFCQDPALIHDSDYIRNGHDHIHAMFDQNSSTVIFFYYLIDNFNQIRNLLGLL